MSGAGEAPGGGRAEVRIVAYDPRWRGDFLRLNVEWLERWFVVEDIDRAVLSDPESHILEGGGKILFAVDGADRALGTVALLHEGDGVYELTKMAVDPGARGLGIGRRLMEAALAAWRALDGRELFLESSSRLAPALALYESVGFRHRPAPRPGSHYARADVYMVYAPGGEGMPPPA
jgi:ribosomal protein S18 acetylase RimI-like enzyme